MSTEDVELPCRTVLTPIAHDFSKKVRSLDVTVEGKDSEVDFSGLYLTEDVINGLHSCGFQKPSPIQLRAIPLGRLGIDLLIQAKSGTGKTCVFSVIGLESVTVTTKNIQVLVMAPCREIAFQNANVIKNMGVGKEGLTVKTFIGGKPIEKDLRRLQLCHMAVGTPGRIAHLIREYNMDLSNIRVFVLDEADKLLDASFHNDLQTVFDALPRQKQTIAASATYPDGLDEFILRFMTDPIKVQLDVSAPVLLAVDQFALNVKKMVGYAPCEGQSLTQDEIYRYKFKCLKEVLRRVEFTQVIIFSAFQLRAEKLYDDLRIEDIDVVLLSGALDQETRLSSLAQLQQGKCRLMVATDLAARGIDCESVDLVINFECPSDLPTYIHRMGRAGRFGSKGNVITFLLYSTEWSSIYRFLAQVNLRVSLIEDVKSLDTVTQQNYCSSNGLLTNRDGKHDREGASSSAINNVNSGDVWEFCKSINGELSLQEYTFQGIHIRTEPKAILKNIDMMKAIFNEAMEKRRMESHESLNAEKNSESNEFKRGEDTNGIPFNMQKLEVCEDLSTFTSHTKTQEAMEFHEVTQAIPEQNPKQNRQVEAINQAENGKVASVNFQKLESNDFATTSSNGNPKSLESSMFVELESIGESVNSTTSVKSAPLTMEHDKDARIKGITRTPEFPVKNVPKTTSRILSTGLRGIGRIGHTTRNLIVRQNQNGTSLSSNKAGNDVDSSSMDEGGSSSD